MPGVHQIRLFGARALLIEGSRLTLVDAGMAGSARLIARYLDRLGWSPADIDLIVISHYHLDHMGGLAELRGMVRAPVAAHVDEVTAMGGGQLPPPNPVQPTLLSHVLEPLRPWMTPPPVQVDLLLRDGDELPGHPDIAVVHAPGHTPGQVALHAPRDGWLFVADALQIRGGRLAPPSRFFTEDMPRAHQTIRRLSELRSAWLLFSHYGVRSADPAELRALARRVLRNED